MLLACRQGIAGFLLGHSGVRRVARPARLHACLIAYLPCHVYCRRGRQVAVDVAEALVFLHTQLHVLHSDLKSR